MVHNLGVDVFETIKDLDSEEQFYQKEFSLDVWDFANTLLLLKKESRNIWSSFVRLVLKLEVCIFCLCPTSRTPTLRATFGSGRNYSRSNVLMS